MAAIKCKECGSALSTKAKQCPACGAPTPKKTSPAAATLAALILGLLVYAIASNTFDPAPATPQKTEADLKREAEFQEVVSVLRALKSQMKNPASFDLESAFKTSDGDLCVMYRGTNSFNAVVSNVLVIKQGKSSDDAKQWNRRCAGKSGEDYTHARRAI